MTLLDPAITSNTAEDFDRDALGRHLEANTRPETVAALEKKIAEQGVEYLYYMVPTIGGRVVAKMVPANHVARNLRKGIAFHRTALCDLQTNRDGELIGGGVGAHEFVGLPEPDTFQVLPWDTKVGRMFCTAYEPEHLPEVGGRPLAVDTRALLRRRHAAFTARTGLRLKSGCEPEMTWVGPGLEVIKKEGGSPAYQVENLEKMRPIFKQLVTYAKAMGLDMIEGDYEDNGQLELNWNFDDADLTTDRLVTYRQICKQVAREFGVTASFMPKPYTGQMGNGCHHNLSLWAGDENILLDPGVTELHMSQRGRYAIGGILAHARGLMAVVASTVNSYKRFWDAGQFAPNSINWGLDTRASMIRISSNGRMEYRTPDASVNPYLSHTLILAAIEEGLAGHTDPGEPVGTDADIIQLLLPTTLGDAIDAFSADPLITATLPPSLREIFLELKKDEWSRYCGVVTEWEIAQYWETLP